jgi:hypothetical protein
MMFDYFSHTYVKCPIQFEERWQLVKAELDRFSLSYERFSLNKVAATDRDEREKLATEDFFACIQDAKDHHYNNCLIFEDDIVIADDHLVNFPKVIAFLDNIPWDMFYFGGTFRERPEQITDWIVRNKLTWCLQAVAVNSTAYDKLLELKNPDGIGDSTICEKIQSQGKTFCVLPRMTYQRQGYSYLQDKDLNYYHWQRDDKHITADKLEYSEGVYINRG